MILYIFNGSILFISGSNSAKLGMLSISDNRDKLIFFLFLIIELNVAINLFSILKSGSSFMRLEIIFL